MADAKERTGSADKLLYGKLKYSTREAFKRLRTNLLCSFPEEEGTCRIIGMTSAQPGEGKSLLAVNLAMCLAELDKRVLLMDVDLFRPSQYVKLGLPKEPGLADLMSGMNDYGSIVHHYTQEGTRITLDVLTSGSAGENASRMLNSKRMVSLLQILRKSYDYIILDMPPAVAVSDVSVLAKRADGVMVVVREQHCPVNLLRTCVDQLRFAEANILGFVMNGSMMGTRNKYGYSGYGGNYYGGYYGKQDSGSRK